MSYLRFSGNCDPVIVSITRSLRKIADRAFYDAAPGAQNRLSTDSKLWRSTAFSKIHVKAVFISVLPVTESV